MPLMIRRTHRILARAGVVGTLVLTVAAAVRAQDPPQEPRTEPPQSQTAGDDQPPAADASS